MSLARWLRALRFPRPCRGLHSASGQRPNLGPPSPSLPPDLPARGLTLPIAAGVAVAASAMLGVSPPQRGRRAHRNPHRRPGRRGVYCAGPAGGQTAAALRRFAGCDTAECSRLNRPVLALDGIPPSSSSFCIFLFTNFNVGFRGCFDRGLKLAKPLVHETGLGRGNHGVSYGSAASVPGVKCWVLVLPNFGQSLGVRARAWV